MSIHNVSKKLKSAIRRLKEHEEISARNKELVLKFKDQLFAEGLTKHRVLFYVNRLYKTAQYISLNFGKVDKQDIKALVSKIEMKDDYSSQTKSDYKVAIKRFYRWLENEDGSEYPDKVKWISTTLKNNEKKLPEEILTKEEVRDMIKQAKHPRDKALVSVLYESGARIGELLSLKLKHVTFDEHGAKLIVKAKLV